MLDSPGLKRLYTLVLPGAGALVLFGIYTWLAKHLLPFAVIAWCFAAVLLSLIARVTMNFFSRRNVFDGIQLEPIAGQLVLYRPLDSADDLFRNYAISIDRTRVGKLRFGEVMKVESLLGVHRVSAEIDGVDVGAATWEVNLSNGRGVTLLIEPTFAAPALRRTAGEWLRFREPDRE